jgi:hypothetical protein
MYFILKYSFKKNLKQNHSFKQEQNNKKSIT